MGDYLLSDIAEIVDCEHKTAPTVEMSDFYSIRTTDVTNGKIDFESANRVAEHTFLEWTKRAVPMAGDIILAREAPVGEVGWIKEGYRVCLGQRTVLIKPRHPDVFNRYLLYYFVSPDIKHELRVRSTGSVVSHLNMKDIRNFEITLPNFPEQKAIASVLSSLDDKIDLLHRQNKTLEAMAETFFRQWFVEESDGDWMDACLEEHTDVYRGLSYKGSGLTEAGFGLPMHNLNSVYEGGGYKEVGIKFYSGDYKERHLVKPNEIIVANTEQGHEFKLIGYPAIVPSSFGEIGLFSQHIYRLIPKTKSYVTSEYLYYLLMTPLVREQVTSATNGSTVNMLAIDGLQRPVFKLPPKEKVFEFTQQISLLWKRREVNSSQIRNLEKLRDTLLPKLMSGEVMVEL